MTHPEARTPTQSTDPQPAARGRSTWLVAGAGSLAVLLMLAVTGLIATRRYNVELGDAARELRTLDLVLAAETTRSFQSVELVLDNVADQVAAEGAVTPEAVVDRMSTESVHQALRARVAGVPQLDAVTVISATGKLINFSRGWPIPDVRLDDRDYFQALRDGHEKIFLSEPVSNRGSGTPTIYLARRLSAPDGTFLGLVLGAVELASFERLYASLQLGPDNVIALWRTDGVLLARYPAIAAGQRMPVADITPPDAPWHGVAGVFERSATVGDGPPELRVVASHAADGVPVQVNIGRSEASILADWRREVAGLGVAVGGRVALRRRPGVGAAAALQRLRGGGGGVARPGSRHRGAGPGRGRPGGRRGGQPRQECLHGQHEP